MREAHEIVGDLFEPSATIYWADFLLTITAAWGCFRLLRVLPNFSAGQLAAYFGAVVFFYRAFRAPQLVSASRACGTSRRSLNTCFIPFLRTASAQQAARVSART